MRLEIDDVHVAYGRTEVVFGVSLDVPDGSLVCLMGRNGVGKTTLLNAVMGLLPVRRGAVRLDDTCSCPVGDGCKHCVAAIVTVRREAEREAARAGAPRGHRARPGPRRGVRPPRPRRWSPTNWPVRWKVVAIALLPLLLAVLAYTLGGVSLAPGQWLALFAVNVIGVLPFCALGLYIGSLVGGNAAVAVVNLLFLPMAFLSGLWMPLAVLPDIFGRLAPAWPAYHLGQIALKVVGHDAGGPPWLHLAVLAMVTAVFFLLARRRLAAAG